MTSPFMKSSLSKPALLLLGGLVWLCALAELVFLMPRYLTDGEAIVCSTFESKPAGFAPNGPVSPAPWQSTKEGISWNPQGGYGRSGGIHLTVEGKHRPALFLDLNDPQKFSYLAFEGKMRTENVVPGMRSWQKARFIFLFKADPHARQWKYPFKIGYVAGTADWKVFSAVVPIPDFAVKARLQLRNMGQAGSMWIDDILLRPLRINPQYVLCRNLLLAAGALLAIAFVFTFRLWQAGGWLAILIGSAIITGIMCSGQYVRSFADVLKVEVLHLKVIGHYGPFLLLALIAGLLLRA